MAAPLVRYSSRLTWRSSRGRGMDVIGVPAGQARADALDIVKDFIDGVESLIPLQHDGGRRLAQEGMIEQIEHLARRRVRMGIDKNWPPENVLVHGCTARHVHLLDEAGRQRVEKFVRIEAVVRRVQIKSLD